MTWFHFLIDVSRIAFIIWAVGTLLRNRDRIAQLEDDVELLGPNVVETIDCLDRHADVIDELIDGVLYVIERPEPTPVVVHQHFPAPADVAADRVYEAARGLVRTWDC